MTVKLAALDLDGTLLDPFGKLTPKVCEAVASLARRDLRVVLCTGRRYRTALPHAKALGLEGAMVVNNGVLVKDIASGETLDHAFLDTPLAHEVIDHVRELGPPLVYVDAYHRGVDIFTEAIERQHPFQREYTEENLEFISVIGDVTRAEHEGVIMVSTMADEGSLDALLAGAAERFGPRVYTHTILNKNYQGHILEFLSPLAGKWATLERLAASWGITPAEIASLGDDTNDAEMIRESGLGIAMANSLPEVREGADVVVPSNAEGGAVEAVDRILSAL